MVRMCCVCKVNWTSNGNRSFYEFPKNEELREQWAQILEIKEIKKSYVVCSDHFDNSSYSASTVDVRRLKKNAIPLKYIKPLKSSPSNELVIQNIKQEICDDEDLIGTNSDNEQNVKNQQDFSANTDIITHIKQEYIEMEESPPETNVEVIINFESGHEESSTSEDSEYRFRSQQKKKNLKPSKDFFINDDAYKMFLRYLASLDKRNKKTVYGLKKLIARQQNIIRKLRAEKS